MVRRPYPTLGDSTHPSTDAVWRALRELRASPPGRATTSARKGTFKAALEQAQQLFNAAAGVGPAARPLLLFYGLSQAGRAIAACAPVPNDKFQLHSHGIANGGEHGDLADVTVQDKSDGAFTQLAGMLDSRTLAQPVRLAELWATIPELEYWPLVSVDRPLVHVSWNHNLIQGTPPRVHALVSELPQALICSSEPAEREHAVREWLTAYPTLDGFDFSDPGVLGGHGGPAAWSDQRGTIGCRLAWDLGHCATVAECENEITPWRGRSLDDVTRTVHSRLGSDDRQLHPLLRWWAVLYTLSMQARYVPHRWTAHVDVNGSPSAVPLEHLLDVALDAVPELVLATIEDLV